MQNQIIPNLTPEQWEYCRWALEEQSLRDAQKFLAQPSPQGIGIHMSVATLGRVKQKLALEDFFDQRQDTRLQTDALAQAEQAAHVQDATIDMLRQKAFQLALSNDPDDQQRACRMLRELALVERDSAHRKNYDRSVSRTT